MRRLGVGGVAAVLFGLVMAPVGAAAGWAVEPVPAPQTPNGQLSSVSCSGSGSTTCTAVGYSINASGVQQTLAERWNGTIWATQVTPNPSGATSSMLTGVSCTAATACTAVGSFATGPAVKPTRALVERWNGTSWTTQTAPAPSGATSTSLSGVSCEATACTAVGSYISSAAAQLSLAEQWNGTSWVVEPTPKPSNAVFSQLNGVSCAAAMACTAVGSYILTPSGLTVTLAERWNGSSWTIQTTPNPSGASGAELNGVSCTAATACTAVGGDFATSGLTTTLAERWNGTSWTIQGTPNPPGVRFSVFTSVSCATATACTATGNSLFVAAPLAERWNGTTWAINPVPSPSSAAFSELGGVSCTAASACTAVGGFAASTEFAFYNGSQATIAERWNGTSWTIQTTPNPRGAAPSSLPSVSCKTGSACIAVGSYETTSAAHQLTLAERWNGTTWTIQPTPNPSGSPSNAFTSASCEAATACTAVGYAANAPLAEHWNGTSWAIQTTPHPAGATSSQLSGVSCTAATACTAVGTYTNNAATQLTLAERWNGTSWTIQTTPNPSGAISSQLSGVSCSPGPACTAVGTYLNNAGFQTLAERSTGSTWTIQTTPTPSFSGFAGDSCAAATACAAVGNVFAEAWNGTTWTTQALATPSGENLDSLTGVSCTAATACTASGSFDRYFQIGFAYSFGSQALVSLPLAERHS